MRTRRGSTWDALAVLKLFDEVNRTNDIDGNTKAQKLTFLLELFGQKAGIRSGHLRFSRYKYGPYSWELPELLNFLENGGFITRTTRQLTPRGRYVLEYALPEVTDGAAADALSVTERIARDYGHRSGENLKKLVYSMRVPVHDRGGELHRINKLPTGIDILVPMAEANLIEPADAIPDLLDELAIEFDLPPDAIDPTNPAVREHARATLVKAIQELTH